MKVENDKIIRPDFGARAEDVKKDIPTFEEVYEKEFSYVYNYVYSQMMHKENTEDIVSEVFMRAMNAYDGYDPSKASIRTWLVTIARNRLINFKKSAAYSRQTIMEDWDDPGENDNYGIYADETSREVAEILEKIPEKDRELLVMRYMMDMDNKAISEIVGATPKNISQRIMRALEKCRKLEETKKLQEF